LKQRAISDVDEAQFARSKKRIDGLADAGARHQVGKELLDFFLLGGDNAVEVLRNQAR
jgi:hypothetical protein